MPDDEYAATSERMDVTRAHASAGDYLIYLFHMAAYEMAAARVAGLRVLDYGCGTGYGSHHLAANAASVVGVDVSETAVRQAARTYEAPGLEYRAVAPVEVEPLPFADGSFDVVVSFQVIEHVPSTAAYLAEATRVLVPGGVFMCVTPDRTTRLYRGQRPWNRWHLDEFTPEQLVAAIRPHLRVDEVLGMTAPPDVLELELRRCRRLRRLTLPFTFPRAPERWRVAGLSLLARVQEALGRARRRASSSRQTSCATAGPAGDSFGFVPDVVEISATAAPSTNIVVVATKA